jgi:hypothetical protein
MSLTFIFPELCPLVIGKMMIFNIFLMLSHALDMASF